MAIQFMIKVVNDDALTNIIKSSKRYIVNIDEFKELLSPDEYNTNFTLSDEKSRIIKLS